MKVEKISVVIPNYNDSRIERTLKSISSQSFKNFEIIVVEGCPNNNNTKFIYQNYNVYLIHENDRGIFDALNKGIRAAKGDIIFLIGSDDYLSDSHVFQSVYDQFQINEKIDGVCIGCKFVNSSGKNIRNWFPSSVSVEKMKIGIFPPHFSLFLTKEFYDKVGLFKFDISSNVGVDSIWLIDSIKYNPKIIVNSDHFLVMEYGGTSTGSLSNILRAMKYIGKAARMNGIKTWFIIPFVKVFSKLPQFVR